MNIFEKLFGYLKSLFTRAGLQKFLAEYLQLAEDIILDLSMVHTNEEFRKWYQEAFNKIKLETKEVKDNWIVILIALAFEELKAKGKV